MALIIQSIEEFTNRAENKNILDNAKDSKQIANDYITPVAISSTKPRSTRSRKQLVEDRLNSVVNNENSIEAEHMPLNLEKNSKANDGLVEQKLEVDDKMIEEKLEVDDKMIEEKLTAIIAEMTDEKIVTMRDKKKIIIKLRKCRLNGTISAKEYIIGRNIICPEISIFLEKKEKKKKNYPEIITLLVESETDRKKKIMTKEEFYNEEYGYPNHTCDESEEKWEGKPKNNPKLKCKHWDCQAWRDQKKRNDKNNPKRARKRPGENKNLKDEVKHLNDQLHGMELLINNRDKMLEEQKSTIIRLKRKYDNL